MKVSFAHGAQALPPNTNLMNGLFPHIGPARNRPIEVTNKILWKALNQLLSHCGHKISGLGALVSVYGIQIRKTMIKELMK